MSATQFQCCLWHSHYCSSPGLLCQLEKKKKGLPPSTLKYLRWTLLSIALFLAPAVCSFCHLRQTEVENPWSHRFLPSLRVYSIVSDWNITGDVLQSLLTELFVPTYRIALSFTQTETAQIHWIWKETVNHWPLHCCGLLIRRKLDKAVIPGLRVWVVNMNNGSSCFEEAGELKFCLCWLEVDIVLNHRITVLEIVLHSINPFYLILSAHHALECKH